MFNNPFFCSSISTIYHSCVRTDYLHHVHYGDKSFVITNYRQRLHASHAVRRLDDAVPRQSTGYKKHQMFITHDKRRLG